MELETRFKAYGRKDLDSLPQLAGLDPSERFAMGVVARVFPFRVNDYVLSSLIDWSKVPDDPMFRLVFPHRDRSAMPGCSVSAPVPGPRGQA